VRNFKIVGGCEEKELQNVGDGVTKKNAEELQNRGRRIGVMATKRNAEELQIMGEDREGWTKNPQKRPGSRRNDGLQARMRVFLPHNKPKREGGRGVKALKITKNY
jgi:hypothetical protein